MRVRTWARYLPLTSTEGRLTFGSLLEMALGGGLRAWALYRLFFHAAHGLDQPRHGGMNLQALTGEHQHDPADSGAHDQANDTEEERCSRGRSGAHAQVAEHERAHGFVSAHPTWQGR